LGKEHHREINVFLFVYGYTRGTYAPEKRTADYISMQTGMRGIVEMLRILHDVFGR